MRSGFLLVALGLAVASAAVLVPGCTKEREDVPGPGSGSGNAPGGTNPTNASTGSGNGGNTSGGGDDGDGGDGDGGGGVGGGGVGGGPEILPQCGCLLDVSKNDDCGTCVSFGIVDECGDLYSACQADGDCIAVDNCVLNEECLTSACLDTCRDLSTPEALDLFDAMYACACNLCADDCDGGDQCR